MLLGASHRVLNPCLLNNAPPRAAHVSRQAATACRVVLVQADAGLSTSSSLATARVEDATDELKGSRSGSPDSDTVTQNKQLYRDEKYQQQAQDLMGDSDLDLWQPLSDPPALLRNVTIILMSPRRPVSIGAAARACSSFECEDLRIVQPRCDHLSRQAMNASHGAQYVLHRLRNFQTLEEALADVDLSVAFTRWVKDRPNAYINVDALLKHPVVHSMLTEDPLAAATGTASGAGVAGSTAADALAGAPLQAPQQQGSSSAGGSGQAGPSGSAVAAPVPQRPRIALVFGREELGISDDEVDTCSAACSILIGRLQESLSLTHAMTVALSTLYQHRQQHLAQAAAGDSSGAA